MSTTRTARRTIGVLAAALLMALAIAAPASALMPIAPGSGLAEIPRVESSYTGWGYPVGAEATVEAWRWTSAGWREASLTTGASVYVYPYGSGWRWAWRGGSWYAVKRTSLTPFSCRTIALDATTRGWSVGAYRYADSRQPLRRIAAGEKVYPICSNTFPDAGGATRISYGGPDIQCFTAPCYVPRYLVRYQLAWIWHGGRWTKAYIDTGDCSDAMCPKPLIPEPH